MLRFRVPIIVIVLVMALALLGSIRDVPEATALSWPVNTLADSNDGVCASPPLGDCSLREAILGANSNGGPDVITFDATVFNSAGNVIEVSTSLPFADASDPITIDATGTPVEIRNCSAPEGCNNLWGLVFVTSLGITAQDIIVRHVSVTGFTYDGLQVCGGVNDVTHTCDSNVSNVTIEDGSFNDNVHDGVRIFGGQITNVTLNRVSAGLNEEDGIRIQGGSGVYGVAIAGSTASENSLGAGMLITADGPISGMTVTEGEFTNNLHDGLELAAGGDISGISISSTTASGNGGTGVFLGTTNAMSSVEISDVTASNNGFHGIALDADALSTASVISSTTEDNVIGYGIFLRGVTSHQNIFVSGNQINRNLFGLGLLSSTSSGVLVEENVVMDNVYTGIYLSNLGSGGSQNMIRGNTVSGNEEGIYLAGNDPPTINTFTATISRNSTSHNTKLGINLQAQGDQPSHVTPNDVGDVDDGANSLLNFPEWTLPDGYVEAEGTACANCLVEVFMSDNDPGGYGEGDQFLFERTADANGHFSIDLCQTVIDPGTLLTSTATDQSGNTSEFSANYTVLAPSGCPTATPVPTGSPTPTGNPTPAPTGTPTPTPTGGGQQVTWGDNNCADGPNPIDALLTLRFDAGLAADTGDCPEFGAAVPAGGPELTWGDVDCSGAIDPVDGLKLLRYDAGLEVVQVEPCPLIGDDVEIA